MHNGRLAVVVAVALWCGSARAQVAPTEVVFTTVDAVESNGSVLTVTGIVRGDSAPSAQPFYFTYAPAGELVASVASCERKALLAMSKPGQYLLTIWRPGPYDLLPCKLTRVGP